MAKKAKKGTNGRTWSMLEKAYADNMKNFDNLCKRIYEAYANSDDFTDIKKVCEQFNVAPSAFGKIQDHVIIEDLVTDHTIELAEKKAVRNQQVHHQLAGRSTNKKVSNALSQRTIRRQEKEIEKEQQSWVTLFTNFTISGLSFKDYAIRNGKTYTELLDLFNKCVLLNLFDDELIDAIRINVNSVNGLTKKQKEANNKFFEGTKMIKEAYENGFTL